MEQEQTPETLRGAVDIDAALTETVAGALRQKLGVAGAAIGKPVLDAAVSRVVEAATARLDTPVTQLLADAWQKYADVQSLAADSADDPEAETVASLAEHRFGWSYVPEVEIAVGQLPPFTLRLAVELGVRVIGGVLVVRGGKLRELRGARLAVGASVLVAEQRVASPERDVDLPGVLRFGADGIALRRDSVPVAKIVAAS